MLRAVDGRRSTWLNRYVRYIVIWKGHYSFANDYGGIFISSEFLLEAEIEQGARPRSSSVVTRSAVASGGEHRTRRRARGFFLSC